MMIAIMPFLWCQMQYIISLILCFEMLNVLPAADYLYCSVTSHVDIYLAFITLKQDD